MYLVQSALRYKDNELGDWKTICIASGYNATTTIIEAMRKVYPQQEYRYQMIE